MYFRFELTVCVGLCVRAGAVLWAQAGPDSLQNDQVSFSGFNERANVSPGKQLTELFFEEICFELPSQR